MAWISQHKLLVILAIVVFAGALWFGMGSSAPPPPLISEEITPTGSPTKDSAEQELVGSLLSLRAVTLSAEILSDPAFISLRDFGTPIVAEPVGRPNPFLPLSGTSTRPAPKGAAAPRR